MSVILPGSYDPVTKGHLDIIRRAAEKYDEVYVVVFTNPNKTYTFSVEDRVRMLMIATDDLDNVMVSYSNGLVIDYMTDHEISKIIKGYRNDEDLRWEREQAEWNWEHGRYETELWKCSEGLENVSSTAAREALMENEPLDMLPEKVAEYIENKINQAIKEHDELTVSVNKASSNAPKLKILRFDLKACNPGEKKAVLAYNLGGEGKGLSILFTGDYVESGEISFTDTVFIYSDGKDKRIETPITLEKIRLDGGSTALRYRNDDFVISSHKTPTLKESEECFGIGFVPQGNKRKFLDINVVIAPNDNFSDGQCSWRVWANYSSKKEYLEKNNETILKDVVAFGIPREFVENSLLNPEEYDLD